MPGQEQLQTLLAITRVLEQAVTNCEFTLAQRLQDELRLRLEALSLAGHCEAERGLVLAELRAANARLLTHAEAARGAVLSALVQLAQRRRAVDGYTATASGR
jgi:sulfur relay (sulfurtransferase) complex TusBCD TusD component (DsrE family)